MTSAALSSAASGLAPLSGGGLTSTLRQSLASFDHVDPDGRHGGLLSELHEAASAATAPGMLGENEPALEGLANRLGNSLELFS